MNYDQFFSDWEKRHSYRNQADNVDQAEKDAIKYGEISIESALSDDLIADSLDEEGIFTDSVIEYELEIDNTVSDLKLEIERRISYLGKNYPFEVNGNTLRYRGSKSGIYELCLGICSINLSNKKFNQLPRLFEELTVMIFSGYIGNDASYLRTGWPNPLKFKENFKKINEQTGEWTWKPGFDLPEEPSTRSVKDGGVDFVIWRDVIDKRSGKLFFIGQCAAGNNWDTKLNDICNKKMQQWFNYPMCLIEPIKVFATPYHIVGINIRDVSMYAGVAIDRIRLSLIAEENEYVNSKLIEKYINDIFYCIESTMGGAWIRL